MELSWAHVHLAVNHFPVVGSILATAFLLWILARDRRAQLPLALSFFVVVAIMGAAAYLTGEPAEETVEHLAGISEPVIESHEEVARTSTIVLAILGAVALVGLFLRRRAEKLPRWFAPAVLALALLASGAMAWTANLGARIRHPEIRSGSQVPPGSLEAPESGEDEGRP